MDMKTFKAGNIEVMSHDYYRRKSHKGTLHMDWTDYNYPQFYLFISKLKEEGWRVPTEKEAYYLLELHKIWIGGFSDKWSPYSSYFIEPIVRDLPLENKIRVLNFHTGKIESNLQKHTLGLLRLVRSL
jgi:hypothetical protein